MAVLCQIIHRMDRLDKKILAVLQANARASLQEIGQAVGLSPSPCWSRIKKMEDSGVIEGYTVRLNPQALDLSDTVLVQVTLDSHSDNTLEKFGETLASIPEVIEITCPSSSARRPPSGVTHTMFCVGSLMSQVLQCTQFCALICSRSSLPVVPTNSYTPAGQ
jgi:biotin operon repressor